MSKSKAPTPTNNARVAHADGNPLCGLDCGPWGIYPDAIEGLLRKADVYGSHEAEASAEMLARAWAPTASVERSDNGRTLVVDIAGAIYDKPNWMFKYIECTAASLVIPVLQDAAEDDRIETILLRIDSPGGTVVGGFAIADAVFALRGKKRVIAQVDGMCCSAGYLIAGQAHEIVSRRLDTVGSIGVISTLYDYSSYFEQMGVEAVPIATGPHKGTGTFGAELTAEQRAEIQRRVDHMCDLFVSAIVRGRDMSEDAVRDLATGTVWTGEEAKDLGLVDVIRPIEETLSLLTQGDYPMSKETPTPAANADAQATQQQQPVAQSPANEPKADAPATIQQIKAACPGASNDFLVSMLEASATVETAKTEHMKAQAATIAELTAKLDAQAAQANTPAEQPTAQKPGVEPVGTGNAGANVSAGDPVAEWEEAIAEHMKAGKDRAAAVCAVVTKNPDLHAAYIAAINEK